jgi:hypothetical protein
MSLLRLEFKRLLTIWRREMRQNQTSLLLRGSSKFHHKDYERDGTADARSATYQARIKSSQEIRNSQFAFSLIVWMRLGRVLARRW